METNLSYYGASHLDMKTSVWLLLRNPVFNEPGPSVKFGPSLEPEKVKSGEVLCEEYNSSFSSLLKPKSLLNFLLKQVWRFIILLI